MRKSLPVVFLLNVTSIVATIVVILILCLQFSACNNMHLIYMTTTTVSYRTSPQIGNRRKRDNRDRNRVDEPMNRNKRYTRRNRGGDRDNDRDRNRNRNRNRNNNKRTEYSRKRR